MPAHCVAFPCNPSGLLRKIALFADKNSRHSAHPAYESSFFYSCNATQKNRERGMKDDASVSYRKQLPQCFPPERRRTAGRDGQPRDLAEHGAGLRHPASAPVRAGRLPGCNALRAVRRRSRHRQKSGSSTSWKRWASPSSSCSTAPTPTPPRRRRWRRKWKRAMAGPFCL